MPHPGLKPGDMVVDLAGMVVSAAVATGGIVGAWLLWLIKRSELVSAGAFVAGAVVGLVCAQVLARILYRTAAGNTTVVKVGISSLSLTIRAGLAGGVTSALVVALTVMLAFGAKSQAASLFGVAIGCGLVVGVLFACLGSLL